jgi:hypothetical protein
MAQTVSRRPPTAEARVRSGVGPCTVICSGRSGAGTGFSPRVLRFPLVSFIPPVLHGLEKDKIIIIIIIIIIIGLHKKPQGCRASVASAAGPVSTNRV